MTAKPNATKLYSLERILAAFGAATCLVLTTVIWLAVSRQQELWPLPAFYLIEVVALAIVAMLGIFRADAPGSLTAWAAVGALVGFAIMPGSSIGFFYMPVATLLGLAALWLDRHAWRRLPLHLAAAAMVGAAEVALIFTLARL